MFYLYIIVLAIFILMSLRDNVKLRRRYNELEKNLKNLEDDMELHKRCDGLEKRIKTLESYGLPSELRATDWPTRTGMGWTLGDYRQALSSVRKMTEEVAEKVIKLEEREEGVEIDGVKVKPGMSINGTYIGYPKD